MTFEMTTPTGPIFFTDVSVIERLLVEQWQLDFEVARLWAVIAEAELSNGIDFEAPRTGIRIERLQ